MASVASGKTSCTVKEKLLEKLQAEVLFQEEVTKLAAKRLAVRTLEADIMSTSNRSVRSSSMRSPDIQSPPTKMHRVGNRGGEPPDGDPNPDGRDVGSEHESYPSTVHKPCPAPSPAPPIVEEEGTTTSQVELPVSTLNAESLIRLQLFPPQVEEFNINTPAETQADTALNAEKALPAQQEFLREEVDVERILFMQQEFLLEREKEGLRQERNNVGADQERLRVMANKVQKQSEIDALSSAMAKQRIQDEESKAVYHAAEINTRSTELNLQEKAEAARRRTGSEEAVQRLRAIELERQHEQNIKDEQRLRGENNPRNMQQRLV